MQVLSYRVQGSQSAFDPYIRNLPVGVAGLPMFFGRDPLRALEYAPVTRQVQMRCQWLLHFAREALQPLPGTTADPFSATLIDANALGAPCFYLKNIRHCVCMHSVYELALEHKGTDLCVCHPAAFANVVRVSWGLCCKHAACSRQMTVIPVVLVGHQTGTSAYCMTCASLAILSIKKCFVPL